MVTSLHAQAQSGIDPAPAVSERRATQVRVATSVPKDAQSVALFLEAPQDAPGGIDSEGLQRAGFRGRLGQTLLVPRSDAAVSVAVGWAGKDPSALSRLRDAAAAYARSVPGHERLALAVPKVPGVAPEVVAQALVEGALLARYRYLPYKALADGETWVAALTLVSSESR